MLFRQRGLGFDHIADQVVNLSGHLQIWDLLIKVFVYNAIGITSLKLFISLLQPFWILHGQHKRDSGGHEKSAGQWHLWIISAGRGQGVTCVVLK